MRKRFPLKNIYLIFFSAFIILMLSGFFVIKDLKERTIASSWLIHSYHVTDKIQATLLSFVEAQTQLQFYHDMHHKKFLDFYQISMRNTQQQLAELKQLTIDNPSQQVKIYALEQNILEFPSLPAKGPLTTKSFHSSLNLLTDGRWFGDVKVKINEMTASENALLEQRTNQLKEQGFLNYIAILVSTLLGYFFLVFSFLSIVKLSKENEKKQLQLLNLEQTKREREEWQRIQLEFSLTAGNLGYWDLDLKTQTATRSLLHDQIFGYKTMLPHWTPKLFLSHVHPDDYHQVSESFNKAVRKHLPWKVQFRIYRADDKSIRWIWTAGQIFKIGMHDHMLGVVQDITETKLMEFAVEKMSIRFKTFLQETPDALIISNSKGEITYINAMAEHLFGYTQSELLGKKIETLIPDRFTAKHEKHRKTYFKKPYHRAMGIGLDLYAKHKNGLEIPVEINLSSIESDEGIATVAAVRDVSERKQMEKLLAESEERWKYALESGNQGVWDWYVPEKIIYFSPAWKAMLGYQDDEVKNEQSEFESLLHPDDLPKVRALFNALFEEKTDEYICEVRFRCKDESYKWILDRGRVVSRDPDGKVLRAIGTHTDISDLKEQELKFQQLSERDALTGLINRRLFEDSLTQAVSLAKRHHEQIAILFLDIDKFKQINDTYGHVMGDLLLCEAANRIKKSLRESDTLARLGGDEFALLLTEITDEKQVVTIVGKIMQHFSKGFLIKNKRLEVTLSIGIALYPKHGKELLIEKADAAMYYVKRHGKNNFKIYNNTLKIN